MGWFGGDEVKRTPEMDEADREALKKRIEESHAEGAKHLTKFDLNRFLVAREYDIDKSYEMLVKHLDWRAVAKPEMISRDAIADIEEKRIVCSSGCDKEGCPLLVMKASRHIKGGDVDHMMQGVTFILEALYQRVKKIEAETGEQKAVTIIYDRTDFSLTRNFDYPLMGRLLPLMQNHYPELGKVLFVVEVTFVFHQLFRMVSVFMAERTKSKVEVLAGDYPAKLREYAEEDQLLVEHGGILTEDEVVAKNFI